MRAGAGWGGRKPPDGKLSLDHRPGFQYTGDHGKCEEVRVVHSKAETLGIRKSPNPDPGCREGWPQHPTWARGKSPGGRFLEGVPGPTRLAGTASSPFFSLVSSCSLAFRAGILRYRFCPLILPRFGSCGMCRWGRSNITCWFFWYVWTKHTKTIQALMLVFEHNRFLL